MKGNVPVQFRGEEVTATPPPYPTHPEPGMHLALFAVDFGMLSIQGKWSGCLAVVCGILGAISGFLMPRRSVALPVGGATGALAAFACARMFAVTYGFGSFVPGYLVPFLPVGLLVGGAAAFKTSGEKAARAWR